MNRTVDMVEIRTLRPEEGAPVTFVMPWRKKGIHVGELLHVGIGSCTVRIPRSEGDGWETTNWALSAVVIPCDRELLLQQSMGTGTATNRVRSTTEKPVETVHRICEELHAQGKDRAEMIEACVAEGVNPNTAKTQYYHWRKNR